MRLRQVCAIQGHLQLFLSYRVAFINSLTGRGGRRGGGRGVRKNPFCSSHREKWQPVSENLPPVTDGEQRPFSHVLRHSTFVTSIRWVLRCIHFSLLRLILVHAISLSDFPHLLLRSSQSLVTQLIIHAPRETVTTSSARYSVQLI